MTEIQILRNEIQARRNEIQIQHNEIQIKSLHFLRRIEPFQEVTLTPHGLLLFGPLPSSTAPRQRKRCLSASDRFSLLPSFRFLRSHEASEGLAPFYDRGWRLS
jgi:hypothetical protein